MTIKALMVSKVKQLLGYDRIQQAAWKKGNPFINTEYEHGHEFNPGQEAICIIEDVAQEHQFYIKACVELRMNYKVVNITGPDWIDAIRKSGCKIFMIWPTIYKPIQKQFWDDRLHIMDKYLGLKIFPSADLLWIYESKRRTTDWLIAQNLAHPKTRAFFDKDQALDFVKNVQLPVVCKTDQGAASSGVFIVRSHQHALKLVNTAFSKGILLKNRGMHDRHQGYIIFQDYLKDCKEWRIIRVGDSYFCRFKLKVGDFHSGSGDIIWAKPPEHLLDEVRKISAQFSIPNINVDFFETTDGKFLINEIHALWGGKVLHDEELEGRYLYNEATGKWSFEKGDFFQNRCANLRLQWVKDNMMS